MMQLYVKAYCPYCRLVEQKLDELGLEEGKEYEFVFLDAEEKIKKLIEVGGKRQVPFLVDGDVKMYESRDINRYLEKKYQK